MSRTCKIIRKSVHTLLQNSQYFTFIAAILAMPFSLSVLISQAIAPRSSSLLPTIKIHLHVLFEAPGFSPLASFFTFVTLKISQTISSSIVTLPFVISFLLLAKASVIHSLKKQPSLSFISLYTSLLSTHLFNSFVVFSANATFFLLFSLIFTFLDRFLITSLKLIILLSAISAVSYSLLLANALVICNLALVLSGMEEGEKSGFMAISRACIMIRRKTAIALCLALPINLSLAVVEALFNFRIITVIDRQLWLVAIEGILMSFLYSLILVLDMIMSCLFYQNCKESHSSLCQKDEDCCYCDDNVKFKGLEEFV